MALQTQEQPLSRQGWGPVSSSTSSPLNPLSALWIVFGSHFVLNYLICNCFLVSDGFLGLSWFFIYSTCEKSYHYLLFNFPFEKNFSCLFLWCDTPEFVKLCDSRPITSVIADISTLASQKCFWGLPVECGAGLGAETDGFCHVIVKF